MPFRLSVSEITRRLQALRNYEMLHKKQKERIALLEDKVAELREENKTLKAQNETLLIHLAELEEKIFGKKRNQDSAPGQSSSGKSDVKGDKKPRSKDSFQRSVPADPPTETKHIPVDLCKHCGKELTQIEEVVRYIEDIILPQLLGKMTKTITKLIIERGYCKGCGNWTSALPLRGSFVSLGRNIKLLVCYLTTILDCSYEQVKTLTYDLYAITLSDGEIASILQETSVSWLPEYERLKQEVRGSPGIHLDETTWPIQIFGRHCYAWVMSAVQSPIRIYKLAASRGKDHAIDLLGEDFEGVRITDCFPGYKNMGGLHQICWAHLLRKIRDLLENKNLPEDKLPYIEAWYDEFSKTYEQLRQYLAQPFNQHTREQQTTELRTVIHELRKPNPDDPKKLRNLKNLLTEYDHALFTCMQFENIPCDNNRAERDLRSLVIKRKKSFGSRTEQGAHAMEVLLSVAWSTWHMHRGNFLPALAKLRR